MPNTSLAPIVIPNTEQETKLESMGLSKDAIIQAISDGLVQFKRATDLHPVTHAGVTAWGEINATLRAGLISKAIGWGYSHQNGLSVTHNKDLGIALVATSGDKDTGLEKGTPCTKNKKGPSTRNLVTTNMTLDLFDEQNLDTFNEEQLHSGNIDSTETWILLYNIDKGSKEIRFELSLPASTAQLHGQEDKLKIDSWRSRIIFAPLPFDNVLAVTSSDEVSFTDEVTFDVSKKA